MTSLRWLVLVTVAVAAILAASPPAAAADCSQTLQSLVDAAPAGTTLNVPACTYHELVQVNKPLTLDGHNAATIEGDTRTNWIAIESSDVTIRNFIMHGGNVQDGQGGIATWALNINNIVIDHNDLSGTANGAGVGIGATTNSRITNNVAHDNGQMGINAVDNAHLLIQGNHVFRNNMANIDPGYAAGGIHVIHDLAGQIIGNEVDHNAGPGIWCDIGCNGEVIANNSVHDQGFNPIFYEISSNGDIYGNTVSNTPPGPLNWGCIIASSSGDTAIHNNTCTNTMALLALLDNRPDVPVDAGHNVTITNNLVAGVIPDAAQANPTELTRWWQYTSSGPLVVGQNGNVDSGNVALLIVTPVATQVPATPTAVPTTAPVPSPTVTCAVNVRINGVERGWKPC